MEWVACSLYCLGHWGWQWIPASSPGHSCCLAYGRRSTAGASQWASSREQMHLPSYQMLGQQVELMFQVKVVNTPGSSDSPEPCYQVVTPAQVKDTQTNGYRAKQSPSILQGATCREAVTTGKELPVEAPAQGPHHPSPTFPSEEVWSDSPCRTSVRTLSQWSGKGWEESEKSGSQGPGSLTCDILDILRQLSASAPGTAQAEATEQVTYA